ncbi:hypothetical protein PybrP1_011011 [[Pythium] brassicae (nom. inval.)]|nr:hypothetical protein PybrP1_011011 [[Pythium] brassicae (nom. inval.)]
MKQLWRLVQALVALVLVAGSRPTLGAECSAEDVRWVWTGALSEHSLAVRVGLRSGHACAGANGKYALVLHAHPELEPGEKPHAAIAVCRAADASSTVASCDLLDSLHVAREYRYELVLARDDSLVRAGRFRTPPAAGHAFSFRVAFSSCADEASDPQVFEEIAQHDPLFFLHMGDLHYHNLAVNDVARFRDAYHAMFASPAGRAMLAMDVPFAYMWDDHDYGPDNSDRTAPGRDAAVQAYREFVPHYPLAARGPRSAVHQAFTVGRVRFILTDLRAERTPNRAPAAPSKSALGAAQKQWFKEELVRATADPGVALIAWVSTMPWIDDERKWGHFAHEQRELVHFLRAHALNTWVPIVVLSGDAHMLAVDDGSHSPGNLTTLHAAALGRPGSLKGGPYSHGAFPGSGQYGVLDFTDDGARVCVHYRGLRVGAGQLLAFDTCHPERTPPTQPYFPPPVAVRVAMRAWKKAMKRVRPVAVGAIGAVALAVVLVGASELVV